MKALSINYEGMEWTETPGYPTGTKIKLLREAGGARTFLLKVPPGFDMEAHAHINSEQHFVLSGEYESEGQKFRKGTYRFIPSRMNHGPFTSKNGAEILVIWEPEN
ncbi:cupin domain-containing protein [candidate division KSB1 bacterium]|nr:cupin domain-containing protein [candidate division KSB1 bacterium]